MNWSTPSTPSAPLQESQDGDGSRGDHDANHLVDLILVRDQVPRLYLPCPLVSDWHSAQRDSPSCFRLKNLR
ncbi:MAG: hypothetical protein WBP67_18980 [Thermoanaerobaculia bacterium]